MGFGLFLGAATKAYNEADAEQDRRKRLDAQQAQLDARFGREKLGWEQEDAMNQAIASGAKSAADTMNEKTPDAQEVTGQALKQKLGLQLSDEAYDGIAEAIRGGADGGKILRQYQADPTYRASPQTMPEPQASVMPQPPSAIPGLEGNPEGGQTAIPVNTQPQAPQMDADGWNNLRTYTGADGKTYMSTMAERQPRQSEIMAMQSRKLMGLGNMKSYQAGIAMHEQAMKMHQDETKHELDTILKSGGSMADKAAKMVGLINDSAIVPGKARVVNSNGTPALEYFVSGQKSPMYTPLQGNSEAEVLSNLRFNIEGMFNADMHHQNRIDAQGDRRVDNDTRSTNASVAQTNAKTEEITAGLPFIADEKRAAINQSKAAASNSYANASYTNEQRRQNKTTFDDAQGLKGEIIKRTAAGQPPMTPEEQRQFEVRGAMITAAKSGDFTALLRSQGGKVQMSDMDKKAMDIYSEHMKQFNTNHPDATDAQIRSAMQQALLQAGGTPGTMLHQMVGSPPTLGNVLANIPPKGGETAGGGTTAPKGTGLNIGAPTDRGSGEIYTSKNMQTGKTVYTIDGVRGKFNTMEEAEAEKRKAGFGVSEMSKSIEKYGD